MTRASQERSAKDILILEMGSNGGWEMIISSLFFNMII